MKSLIRIRTGFAALLGLALMPGIVLAGEKAATRETPAGTKRAEQRETRKNYILEVEISGDTVWQGVLQNYDGSFDMNLADEPKLTAFVTFASGSEEGALAKYGFGIRRKIVTSMSGGANHAKNVSYSHEDQKITGQVYLPLNEKVEIVRSVRLGLALTLRQVGTAQRSETDSTDRSVDERPSRKRIILPSS